MKASEMSTSNHRRAFKEMRKSMTVFKFLLLLNLRSSYRIELLCLSGDCLVEIEYINVFLFKVAKK